MTFVLTLALSAATTALAIQLALWHVEGPGIRTTVGRAVCANRGRHRLTLAEHHWLEPGDEVPGTLIQVDGQSLILRETI